MKTDLYIKPNDSGIKNDWLSDYRGREMAGINKNNSVIIAS